MRGVVLHPMRVVGDGLYAKGAQVCRTQWLQGRGSHLLALAEVRQVMCAKHGCTANEVLSDKIVVNDRGLSKSKLDLLLGYVQKERKCVGCNDCMGGGHTCSRW